MKATFTKRDRTQAIFEGLYQKISEGQEGGEDKFVAKQLVYDLKDLFQYIFNIFFRDGFWICRRGT